MNHLSERYLKTGGDPRTLPDYTALRDELAKLSHPARPDVNWHHVEKLCLVLFEHNGVELQTAAWYTQARTQLAGLAGLNEGLAILDALITHQWGSLWPPQMHARVEILSGLSRRIQQILRRQSVAYRDLGQLYRAEQQLNHLGEVLQRLELRHLSQFDALAALMHSNAVRLENSDAAQAGEAGQPSAVVLPAAALSISESQANEAVPAAVKWVYVAQQPPAVQIEVAEAAKPVAPQPPLRRWRSFAAGAMAMLLLGGAAQWGWQRLYQPNPLLEQLHRSLQPWAQPLSAGQLQALRGTAVLAKELPQQTRQQLMQINRLPVDWRLDYGQRLVGQALAIAPHSAPVQQLAQQWQQQLNAAALPAEAMNGWQQGMAQLQQLADKLNALDGQRGKYLTVSELKSVIFGATQAFNRAVPAEEQLRRYASDPSDRQQQQAGMALEQLEKRYFLLQQQGGAVNRAVEATP